jgi:hypothetical protein
MIIYYKKVCLISRGYAGNQADFLVISETPMEPEVTIKRGSVMRTPPWMLYGKLNAMRHAPGFSQQKSLIPVKKVLT